MRSREGERTWNKREGYQGQWRDGRDSFEGPSGQGRREYQDRDRDLRLGRQGYRDLEHRDF